MLDIAWDTQKNVLIEFNPFKNITNIFMLALTPDVFKFIYNQYQNLGANLEKLYNVMMDLAHDLQVRKRK